MHAEMHQKECCLVKEGSDETCALWSQPHCVCRRVSLALMMTAVLSDECQECKAVCKHLSTSKISAKELGGWCLRLGWQKGATVLHCCEAMLSRLWRGIQRKKRLWCNSVSCHHLKTALLYLSSLLTAIMPSPPLLYWSFQSVWLIYRPPLQSLLYLSSPSAERVMGFGGVLWKSPYF